MWPGLGAGAIWAGAGAGAGLTPGGGGTGAPCLATPGGGGTGAPGAAWAAWWKPRERASTAPARAVNEAVRDMKSSLVSPWDGLPEMPGSVLGFFHKMQCKIWAICQAAKAALRGGEGGRDAPEEAC